MKRFLLLFSIGALFLAVLSIFQPMAALADGQSVRDGVIRLHVLANSDSESDQSIKLAVRDRVLDCVEEITNDCTNREEAECAIRDFLPDLQEISRDVIEDQGADYPVRVTLDEEYYPTRSYEGLRLPAGRYLSLRIIIGSGEGHNWWCVLFPPVCTSSASADEELAEVGFTPNQVRMLTDDEDVRYVVRFRIVEVFSDIKERLHTLFR